MSVALNFYLTATTSGGWRTIDEATQAAATNTDGWVVGTGTTNASAYFVGVERAASTFADTTPPDGSLDTTNFDAFRSTNAYTGDFASANWTFTFNVCAVTSATGQDGNVRFRIFKADSNGANATEITAAIQEAGTITNVAASPGSESALVVNPGAFSLDNQYLFIQIAWLRSGSGASMTTADVNWRTGQSTTVGTRIVTASFTPTARLSTAGTATATGTGASTATSDFSTSGSSTTVAVGAAINTGNLSAVEDYRSDEDSNTRTDEDGNVRVTENSIGIDETKVLAGSAVVLASADLSTTGSSTAAVDAVTLDTADLSASGMAVGTLNAVTFDTADFSATGVAVATGAGAALDAADLSATAAAVGTLATISIYGADLSATGSAVGTLDAVTFDASSLSAAGTGVGTMSGAETVTADLSATGIAVATATGAATITSDLSAIGAGAATGDAATVDSADLNASGISTATVEGSFGAGTASGDISATGMSTAIMVGEAVVSGASTVITLGARPDWRQRRAQRCRRDECDVIALVDRIMPTLLEEYRDQL